MEVILAISSDSGEEVSVDSLPCGRWEIEGILVLKLWNHNVLLVVFSWGTF